MTILIILISVCHFIELHSAITIIENVIFYQTNSFMFNNDWTTYRTPNKTLLHCVTPNSDMH